MIFNIEDEIHAELQDGDFCTFEQALVELRRRAKIPWDKEPNKCPCTNWESCERKYYIIEYDNSSIPWIEISRNEVLAISKNGIKWSLK